MNRAISGNFGAEDFAALQDYLENHQEGGKLLLPEETIELRKRLMSGSTLD